MSADNNPVLLDYPNAASNALLMMGFSKKQAQQRIRDAVRKTLSRYGKHVLRADEKAYARSLWDNVKFYLDACDLGVAVFDQVVTSDFNSNVSLELGYNVSPRKKGTSAEGAVATAIPVRYPWPTIQRIRQPEYQGLSRQRCLQLVTRHWSR